VERPRRVVRFARLIQRRGRAFWRTYGSRRLRRQSQPDLVDHLGWCGVSTVLLLNAARTISIETATQLSSTRR
jgi:hypothetical protein